MFKYNFSFFIRFKERLLLLNNKRRSIQKENSIPANPKKIKLNEKKFSSSKSKPWVIVSMYKIIHISSESNIRVIKFELLKKKIKNANQKIKIQKFNQIYIFKKKIIILLLHFFRLLPDYKKNYKKHLTDLR